VDTGRLRSSIRSELSSDGEGQYALVGSDVEYAVFVEYGTYRKRPASFLRRAVDEVARGV
jgi:phage gpG-like protein